MLVTAVAAREPRENIDFFPLTVDYQEKTFAAGKIPGGFFKREGRPSEKEVLTSRLCDRPLRPLFPDGFRCETQVIATVLSYDKENDADVPRHDRRLGGARDLRHPVRRPDRRRTRWSHRRDAGAQPDRLAAPAVRSAADPGRLARCAGHGRGRSEDAVGGRDPRGAVLRSPRTAADPRHAGGSAQGGRQAEADGDAARGRRGARSTREASSASGKIREALLRHRQARAQ